MYELMIAGSVAGLVLTGAVHSILGERLLLRLLFAMRGNRVLDHWLARCVLRFAWHVTTLSWVMLAVILGSVALGVEDTARVALWSVGVGFTFAGVFDLIASRGRHVGWPMLLLTGLLALAALALGPV